MNWHLITSSKGGVGKTLLATWLLINMIRINNSKGKQENILVIDLNGMNADLRRIVGGGGKKNMQLKGPANSSFPDLHIELTDREGCMIAWPLDPFKLFNSSDFLQFLKHIVDSKGKIEQKMSMSHQIDTVLIDTNYHFCNLFSNQANNYMADFKKGGSENLFIWFVWVYRHFKNLMEAEGKKASDPYLIDAQEVLSYVLTIEGMLQNEKFRSQTPFVHVVSPWIFSSLDEGNFLDKIGKKIQGRTVKEIDSLKKLAELHKQENTITFRTLVSQMKKVKETHSIELTESTIEYFHRILGEYVKHREQEGSGLPLNLVPLYFYEKSLPNYTEVDRVDFVRDMGEHESCKLLRKFLEKLLD